MRAHLVVDLAGREVVVVGCGAAGAEKVERLVAAGAKVTAIDPAPGVLGDLAGVVRVRRPFEAADVDGAWLVVAATGDDAVNGEVVAAAEQFGVWVSRSDRADGGSVAFAAAVDRGRVQIGVSTGGISPSLARWVRDRIDQALPPAVGEVARLLADLPRRDGSRRHRGIDFDAVLAAVEAGDVVRARTLLETLSDG